MNFAGVIRLAISRILASKTRSALTALGVVIGVGSLVALLSIAQGATSGINASLASLGGNKVSVTSTTSTGLSEQDAADLGALPGVAKSSYTVTSQGTATYGSDSATVTMTGVSATYAETAAPDLAAGSFLSAAPIAQNARAVVLSASAATSLGLASSDVGSTVGVGGRSFTVVGILDDSTGFGGGSGGVIYVPLGTARATFASAPWINSISLVASSAGAVDGIVDSTTRLLEANHHVDSDNADFTVVNQASIASSISSISTILELLLGGIASISLIVGGVGIMNIMLVSVRERTREIGIRRAIGAKRRTILIQFLVEAVVLSLLGGIVGLVLGAGVAYLVSLIGGWAFGIEGWVVALSLGFSALVGIVFGVGPARAAARMLPVEALRYE